MPMDQTRLLTLLNRYNRWWDGGKVPESIRKNDYHRRDFHYLKRQLLDGRRIITVRGPRQVGKTTLCGQLIHWLLDLPDVQLEDVLYLTADNTQVMSNQDQIIRETLETYEQYVLQSTFDEVERTIYVFIDEVQRIDDWAATLKYYIDTYPNLRFVVTGSISTLIKSDADETLVGRRQDQLMVPLKFVDYVGYHAEREIAQSSLDIRGSLEAAIKKNDRGRLTAELAKYYGTHESEFPRLKNLKNEYLLKGGYPGVLDDGYPDAYSKLDDDLRSTVLGDLNAVFDVKKPKKILRVLDLLAASATSKVSIQSVADSAGVDRDTVERYIEYLEKFFIVNRVQKHTGSEYAPRSQEKIYFQDVGLYNTVRGTLDEMTLRDTQKLGPILETAVCDHVRRLQFSLSSTVEIGYYDRGGEVDFVLSGSEYLLPIEVKNGDSTNANLGGLKRFLEETDAEIGLVVNNSDVFESDDEVLHLPSWLFLYLC